MRTFVCSDGVRVRVRVKGERSEVRGQGYSAQYMNGEEERSKVHSNTLHDPHTQWL